jgi:enoyl-CoA hydratase/carnithine racemase
MTVNYRAESGVGVFTIENGRMNVFSMDMHETFYHLYLQFLADDSVTVGVLTGAGENFSAGDDLKDISSDKWKLTNPRWDHMLIRHRRTKPMIAAINGWCLGAGFLFAMNLTDIRIAGRSAKMGAPEIAYGLGGMGGATHLGSAIAPIHAAYLCLTGEKINAAKAAEMTLVNEVVEDDVCLDRAMTIAATIASYPLEAVKVELDCLHRSAELSAVDSISYTQNAYFNSRKIMGMNQEDLSEKSLNIMKNKK